MAVSLKGDDFGRLVDPFGGRRDLEARHDPRAPQPLVHRRPDADLPRDPVREPATGSGWSEHTRAARPRRAWRWASSATSPRRGSATSSWRCSRRARSRTRSCASAELGADRAIHPHLAADEEAVALLGRLRRAARPATASTCRTGGSGSTALARRLPPDELYDWLEPPEAAPPRRRGDRRAPSRVGAAARRAARGDELSPAEVVALAEPYAPDAPLLALALADLPRAARLLRAAAESVRLEIGGADLAELGLGESPRVGEILAELRRRKLNGELDGRESELAAARELIARRERGCRFGTCPVL